jgi:hypothetical protein
MNLLNNKYLKIFLLLGAAYIISYFSINNIFLAESPMINPFFAQNMMAKVNNFWTKTTNFIAFKKNFPVNTNNNSSSNNYPTQAPSSSSQTFTFSLNNLPKDVTDALSAPLTKVSQGVYAGEKNDIKIYEIRTGEIEYIPYTYNINGTEKKINVPKGQEPPSQEVVEALYK